MQVKLVIFSVIIVLFIKTKNSLGASLNAANALSNDPLVELVLLGEKHPCLRKCIKDAPPLTCRYKFVLEWYDTLSKACFNCPYNTTDCFRKDCIPGDGNKRPVLVINRSMPGPRLEVCQGDEIIVDVENALQSDSTTIHWHGQHQRKTPYMDGVPLVTQCPVPPGSTFRYQFNAETSGTHFWHSHTGMQRADGAFGALIVRTPEEDDPHNLLYDYDMGSHVMMLIDWGGQVGIEKFVHHHHNNGDNKPLNLLINGLGRFKEFNIATNETGFIPTERFVVERGYRYRFRVINGGFLNCPIEVSVDNHTLTVISSDGFDISPIMAESIVTYAGERFDFIINADQPEDVYWMRFMGLMDCDERYKSAHQVAVLQYQGSNKTYPDGEFPSYANSHKDGVQVNALNQGTESNSSVISVPEFSSLHKLKKDDQTLKEKADFQYYVSYDFYKINNPHFNRAPFYGVDNLTRDGNPKTILNTPQLNFISMKMLSFPMLSQRSQIEDSMLCNETTAKNCTEDFCECSHVVKVPLNAVVELVIIDKGFMFDANHPFHLHGHAFRVVAMEKMGPNVTVEQVQEHDAKGLINRNLENPPWKDTVTVPDGGYTILRFTADNPGYWLFHCHIEFHAEVGMALVFKVGEDSDMLPVPPNFPTCGDYLPEPEPKMTVPDCKDVSVVNRLENDLQSIFGEKCKDKSSGYSLKSLSIFVYIAITLWIPTN